MKKMKPIQVACASVLALSMMTITACGAGKKDDVAPATTAPVASATVTSAAAPTSSAVATSSPVASASSVHSSAASTASSQAAAPAPQVLPAPAPSAAIAPVAGGRPGTPTETQAITDMLKRQESATTVSQYFGIFVDSMCSELINEHGGPEAFSVAGMPDVPLASIPEYQATATKVTGVDKLMVDGTRATADVTTVTGAGQTATNTMAFRNEQGAWKLCR